MIEFAHQNNISLKQIAYIGDDLNDLELLKEVGYSFAPKNASKIVKDNVDYCCESVGGAGAFRESVEKLLSILGIDTIECFNRNSQ